MSRLVLKRKAGQAVKIGELVTVHVVDVSNNSVRLAIEAPKEMPVWRTELLGEHVMGDEEGPCATAEKVAEDEQSSSEYDEGDSWHDRQTQKGKRR